jgi:hypothetical protein
MANGRRVVKWDDYKEVKEDELLDALLEELCMLSIDFRSDDEDHEQSQPA